MTTLAELFMNTVKDMGADYDKTLSAWLISAEIKDVCRVNNTDTIRFRDGSHLTVDHIDGELAPKEANYD